MSELRRDPATQKLVIIAGARRRRPTRKPKCPFCEGHENETPPEIYALRKNASRPNGPGWYVRVIPNKYPALSAEVNLTKTRTGLLEKLTGAGAHEIIVESPAHITDFCELPLAQIRRVIKVYMARLRALQANKKFKSLVLFKNAGAAAGASLEHVHSQLIALPVLPDLITQELENAAAYYKNQTKCLYCELIQQELKGAERVIEINAHFVVLAPFASRFPFECHIVPRRHGHDFSQITPEAQQWLAHVLKRTLLRLKAALSDLSFNLIVCTAPSSAVCKAELKELELERSFHWRMEILPRTAQLAGLEWGSGIHVNPVAPEEAAKTLREMSTSADPRLPADGL